MQAPIGLRLRGVRLGRWRGRRPELSPLAGALALFVIYAPPARARPEDAAARYAAAAAVPTPHDRFGALYARVEQARIFPDQKTFADAVPLRDPAAILHDWRAAAPADDTALRAFVRRNFRLPSPPPKAMAAKLPPPPMAVHIAALWPRLVRQSLNPPQAGSALALPRPYVVPGGRFTELYYWDSYFTILGLVRDGRADLARDMIADFISLIDRYGHVPNGSRTYYLSRSQPPFLWAMFDAVPTRNMARLRARLAALEQEHAFWMAGRAHLAPGEARLHVVAMPDGSVLNRYYDARDTPRDESWANDVAIAAQTTRPAAIVYRDLRAGAESGWDFSSRWLADGKTLASIDTTALVEPDLNSLLYAEERTIVALCQRLADPACAKRFAAAARHRASAMRHYLWDAAGGLFRDRDWQTNQLTGIASAATLYPLFTHLANKAEAGRIAAYARAHLLAPGGLRTTQNQTGQQWDAPNGWAPLQWIAYVGLRDYGEADLARAIACRWRATVADAYAETGKLVEKYNVEQRRFGGGGEYRLQDGFGWTNGVQRALAGVRCGT